MTVNPDQHPLITVVNERILQQCAPEAIAQSMFTRSVLSSTLRGVELAKFVQNMPDSVKVDILRYLLSEAK